MTKLTDHIDAAWLKVLQEEFNKNYFKDLESFLKQEYKQKVIFPPFDSVFNFLNLSSLDSTKVIILGQDPYHGYNQANGLAFSVKANIVLPPSLRNIFRELEEDLSIKRTNGDLTDWAEQGVLLLNTVLTVEKANANSHRNQGWEQLTDKIIQLISELKENCVFILWGSPAHKKENLIDNKKHLILKSVHPSPLSSYRGFFGSKPFSKTNDFLIKNTLEPINW